MASPSRLDALSEWNAVEERYDRVRGLADGRRLGCQATVQGDIVIDVPPKARSTARSCARPPPPAPSPWTRPRAIVLVEVRSRTCTNPPAIWSG
jgi:hypothetical protein